MAIRLKVQETSVRLSVGLGDNARFKAEQGIPIYPDAYTGGYEVTPTESEQVLQTKDLMMTDDVTIQGIPDDYVGSAIDRRDSSDLSVSGPTVSVPGGYYEESASATVQNGSAAVPNVNIEKSPTISVTTGGLITATVSTSETVSPAITEGYIDSGSSGTIAFSGTATSQLTVNTSGDLTASGNTVTASPGFYAESASKSVSNGNIGVPYITKDAVSNHSVKLTPFYTRTQGWITGSGTYSGTQTTVYASDLVSGTLSITQNTTGQDVTNYQKVDVAVPGPVLETVTTSYVPSTSAQTDTITTSSGYDGIEQVNITVSAVTSGSAGTPTATKGTVTNHSVTVTPSVTNTTGYINGGTINGTAVTVSASELVSGSQMLTANNTYDVTNLAEVVVLVDDAPTLQTKTNIDPSLSSQTITADEGYDGLYSVQINAMPSGTAGTPSASKGAVNNHSITVTPSVTNATGYITGGTINGTAVTVSASEVVSGTYTVTTAGTADVTNYASVSVGSGSATVSGTVTAAPGITVNTSSGLITASTSTTKSLTPTVSTGWVSSGTAGNITVNGSNTLQLDTVNGATITATTTTQTAVAANKYTLGAITVAALTDGNNIGYGITDGTIPRVGIAKVGYAEIGA